MKFNTFIILAFLMCTGLLELQADVKAIVYDEYIGGTPTKKQDLGKDYIGPVGKYQVDGAWFNYKDNGTTIARIYSDYFDNVGSHESEMGDLFLSTDGWNPAGSAAGGYKRDTYYTGETWEYALVLDDHLNATAGDLRLYKINSSQDILLTDDVYTGGSRYRADQEVQVNTASAEDLGIVGSWNISSDSYNHFLQFVFDYENTIKNEVRTTGLGFHWTMSHGSDVAEGFASSHMSVPEPGIMQMLAILLISVSGLGFAYGGRFVV